VISTEAQNCAEKNNQGCSIGELQNGILNFALLFRTPRVHTVNGEQNGKHNHYAQEHSQKDESQLHLLIGGCGKNRKAHFISLLQ
jgi:hypothetical protein